MNVAAPDIAAGCLRDIAQFGGYQIYNVCSGEAIFWVPWGLNNWFAAAIAVLSLIGFSAAIVVAFRRY